MTIQTSKLIPKILQTAPSSQRHVLEKGEEETRGYRPKLHQAEGEEA